MTTVRRILNFLRSLRSLRSQLGIGEGIGMKTAAVNLDAQHLFKPHIAQMYLRPEVIEQSKLAGFVGRFKENCLVAESLNKTVGKLSIKLSSLIKQADSA